MMHVKVLGETFKNFRMILVDIGSKKNQNHITRGASTVRQRCFQDYMNSFSLSLSVVATHTSRQ